MSAGSQPASRTGGETFSTAGTVVTESITFRQTTWPVIECDQNNAPNLFDIVTPEVAAQMPPGTEVIVSFTERRGGLSVALEWGYAALMVVTEHKPTGDGEDVVVYVQPV